VKKRASRLRPSFGIPLYRLAPPPPPHTHPTRIPHYFEKDGRWTRFRKSTSTSRTARLDQDPTRPKALLRNGTTRSGLQERGAARRG